MNRLNSLARRQIADLCILFALGAIALVYLYDTYQASGHVYNLIFVVPLCLLVFLLCLLEFIGQLSGRRAAAAELEPVGNVAPAIGLFIVYVLSLHWVGFDLGTTLFVGAFLWLHGERRIPWLIGYALVFALLTTLFFTYMLPYPMPLMFFPTDY